MTIYHSRDDAREAIKKYLPQYLESKGINIRKNFSCLNPTHADKDPSMSLDRKGTQNSKPNEHVKCFACNAYYDIFDLISIDYGIDDPVEVFKKAYELYDIELMPDSTGSAPVNKSSDKPASVQESKPAKTDQSNNDNMDYYKSCMSNLEQDYTYLQARGISLDTAKKHWIGLDYGFKAWLTDDQGNKYSKIWSALIIPTGKESYVARNTDPKGYGKSRYQKRGSVNPFNVKALYKADKPIYIVEGELDALSIIEVGGIAVGLGSTAYINNFLKIVKNRAPVQPLILALDNDDEGKKAEEALAKGLEEAGISFYRYRLVIDHKDPNEALLKDREGFTLAVKAGEDQENVIKDLEKEEYLNTSVANHIQEFINGISASIDTPCIPTGFNVFDTALDGGLYEGLYVLGAITSLGKTTFVMQIADQIAQQGHDVLIFSLEMARSEIMAKSISRLTMLDVSLNNGELRNAKTTRGITAGAKYAGYSITEKEIIKRSIEAYKEYANHIYINEGVGDIGVTEIREQVKKHISFTGNAPVVIIDYIQIMAPYNDRATDKQNTDKAVLELKRLSRDMKIPVIGISSLNRASYGSAINLEAFKESGAIEYGSDVVIGLQLKGAGEKEFDVNVAKSKNPREVELRILKNRNGSVGSRIQFEYFPMFNYYREV